MTETSPSGYSGTPLPRKLGLKDGQRVAFLGLPEDLGWLREAAGFVAADTGADHRGIGEGYDVIHAFFTAATDLAAAAPHLMKAIVPVGMIWVSWPKKASKRPTDITEDVIRSVVLPLGLVDVKVCSVTEVWSGLKLVIRKEFRPASPR